MGLAGVDTGRLATYSEDVAADPILVELRDKVEFEFRHDMPNTLAELELQLSDGTHVTAQHDSGVPATDVTAQGNRLEEKFTSLVEPVLGAQRCQALIAQIGSVDRLPDVREIMRLSAA
jgi:hypothetical protein